MKKYWLFLAVIPVVLISCKDRCIHGDGNVINNAKRYFDTLPKIQSDIKSNVYVTLVNDTLPDEVFIRCDGNLDPYIITWIDESTYTLHIEQDDDNCIKPTKPIEVYVYSHNITGITSNSSGNMYCDNITSPNLKIQVLGNGGIYMTGINTDLIMATLSGNGVIELVGQGMDATYTNMGSGRFTAAQMLLNGDCTAACQGNGNMSVYCKGILNANPGPGTAVITFYGSPQDVIGPYERVVPGD